jgi:XTP/dITP diphosphohydrolase
MIIHIGTSNEGKFREMVRMLKPLGHEVVKEDIPYPEIQADTLWDVVQFGIQWLLDNDKRSWLDDPDHGFIIDDSGIFIKPLKDFPGVYSKFVFYSIGTNGILHLLQNSEHRDAVFKTSLMFHTHGRNHYFEGTSNGTISVDERGTNGFGYDPIFIPNGSDKTFAEMDIDEKNAYSHRGKAMEQFIDFLVDKAPRS